MAESCPEGFVMIWMTKHERAKYNICIFPSHIWVLFQKSLGSKHGRKNSPDLQGCQIASGNLSVFPWPQFESQWRLKGWLCVSVLFFVLPLTIEGLCGEPCHGANAENYLVTLSGQFFNQTASIIQLSPLSLCLFYRLGRKWQGGVSFLVEPILQWD